jgi:hypothetical protein
MVYPDSTPLQQKQIEFQVYEHFYKWERDERAFNEAMSKMKTTQGTSVKQFLASQTASGQDAKSLQDLMKRKKVTDPQREKNGTAILPRRSAKISVLNPKDPLAFLLSSSNFASEEAKEVELKEVGASDDQAASAAANQVSFLVNFAVSCHTSSFIEMPKGDLTFSIVKATEMLLNDVPVDNLVFKFSKLESGDGDVMTYLAKDCDTKAITVELDSLYYTDFVTIHVYHRGAVSKQNFVGKAKVSLHSLCCTSDQISELKLYNKRAEKDLQHSGTVYLNVKHNPCAGSFGDF